MNNILDIPVYRKELSLVAKQIHEDWLRSRVFLVTGASGLIGSAVVDLLIYLKELFDSDLSIVVVGRSLDRLQERFGDRSGLSFALYSDVVSGAIPDAVTDLVLAASPASPDLFVADPESVWHANTTALVRILKYAGCREGRRAVYVSSSEVYGDAVAQRGGHVEDVLGEIDEDDVRSCYALSKRQAESICREVMSRLAVKIVRPGHIYGPTALRSDRRVSSMWAYDSAEGRDIVMKSSGSQLRSYTHCLDCASAILYVLACGASGESYNISNSSSVMTIRQLAEIVSAAAGVRLICKSPSDSERTAFNPMFNSSLNSGKIERLGWRAAIGGIDGVRDTVCVLRTLCADSSHV